MTDVRHTAAWATARKAWQQAIDQGLVDCQRCRRPIAPTQAWDLGHPQDRPHQSAPHDLSVIPLCRPEHVRCSRRAGPRERRAVTAARTVTQDQADRLW